MHRTLLPGRFIFCALLGVLATGAACGGQDPAPIPPGAELNVSAVPPPPISGGTLIVTSHDLAVASDPDRDLIWIADINNEGTPKQIKLDKDDEPGRLIEDATGKVHVALRRGGAIVTIDPATAKLEARRAVCPSPRGIAYDKTTDQLHVACEGGELVSLPAAGGDATRTLHLARDLRDVIVEGDHLLVSRFRTAELLVVKQDGTAEAPYTLPEFVPNNLPGQTYSPGVAWRTVAMPTGGALMIHQRGMSVPITLAPGGYYQTAGCDGSIIHAAVSVFRSSTGIKGRSEAYGAAAFPSVALPVDVAVTADGQHIAMAGAGSNIVIQTGTKFIEDDAGSGNCTPEMSASNIAGEPVALAFSTNGRLFIQTRQPAIVELSNGAIAHEIDLPGESRADTAHDMFHQPPNGFSGIACASCHPEGHDDGRTWVFTTPEGGGFKRRTQNVGLGGGLLSTAPFHWAGDLGDMSGLMSEVFVKRMGGVQPGPHKVLLISKWLDQLPALPPSPAADATAVSRGAELFNSEGVGCVTCHNGAKLTNNKTVDVGTGSELQVPSLISVASRAPFMHDGCAPTLLARLTDTACGGGDKHGHTSQLSASERADLIAYLESL